MFRNILILCSLFTGTIFAQNPYITTTTFISGLTSPLTMSHCKDERVFIVQKNGIIRIADAITGVLRPTPFLDIDSRVGSTGSEQGLLGMAFHPDYKNNGYFFVNYTNNNGNTTISRFRVNPADSNLALANSELILQLITQPFSNHNGGNIAFGPDGYLYIGMGDGGSLGDPGNRAQNPNELLGKMLRIDVNQGDTAVVPATNPFINSSAYKAQIWQVGVRNPWRFSFDNKTGDLWIGDVGENASEEIDFQPASSTGGENWGWRCYEGNGAFNTTGCNPQSTYTPPIYQYSHSGGNCSVSGGYVYRGPKYPNLNGYYLFTDYCTSSFRTLHKTAVDTSYLVHSSRSAVVGFGEDYFGELYAFSLTGGTIYRIKDTTSCGPNVMISEKDTIQLCDTIGTLNTPFYPGFVYNWSKDGIVLSTATPSLEVNADGLYAVTVLDPQSGCTNSDSVFVRMGNPNPQLSWSSNDTLFCSNNGPVVLGATPIGGTFFGLGVSDTLFNTQNLTQLANGRFSLLQYTYTDSLGCKFSIVKKAYVRNCTGVNENTIMSFLLYPNPANTEVNISFNAVLGDDLAYTLQDASGRVVKKAEIPKGVSSWGINTANLDAGSYLLSVKGSSGFTSRPLMIVH